MRDGRENTGRAWFSARTVLCLGKISTHSKLQCLHPFLTGFTRLSLRRKSLSVCVCVCAFSLRCVSDIMVFLSDVSQTLNFYVTLTVIFKFKGLCSLQAHKRKTYHNTWSNHFVKNIINLNTDRIFNVNLSDFVCFCFSHQALQQWCQRAEDISNSEYTGC